MNFVISPDGISISITYALDSGWTLSKTNMDFQFSESEFSKCNGKLRVCKLKKNGFRQVFDPPVTTAGPFTKALSDMENVPDPLCDATLFIAARCTVTGPGGDTVKAWADPTPITGTDTSCGGLASSQITCDDQSGGGDDPPPPPGGDDPPGPFESGCQTSWARYMLDDNLVTRKSFQEVGISNAWGWFQCTKIEGTYQSTMVAAQFYDTGRMHWTYSLCILFCWLLVNMCLEITLHIYRQPQLLQTHSI